MQHHWKKVEKHIDNWTEIEVQNYLDAGGHKPTGNLNKKKEFIKDLEYNWVVSATDEDMADIYPTVK